MKTFLALEKGASHKRPWFLTQQHQTLGGKLVPVFNFKDLLENTNKIINARMPKPYERILCAVHKELFGDTSGPENTILTKF